MRMRTARTLTAASSIVALALVAGGARAQGQVDLNPPRPNVLLLVDNSGSMERMIDGTLPEDNAANACDVSNCIVGSTGTTCTWAASAPAAANRWNTLLQALVGTPVNGFHCIGMPRTANTTFTDEYQINGALPYDTGYYLRYHRAVAKDTKTSVGNTIPCVIAPGTLPGAASGAGVGIKKFGAGGSADAFPANAIISRPYGQTSVDQSTTTMACQFGLNGDGSLLVYQDLMRFSLMTFDQDPAAGTGVSSGPPFTVSSPGAFDGMWSYFLNWGGGGAASFATGNPLGCGTAQAFEVGARNPAAPPWEGRMVPFPPPGDADAARQAQNQQIRSVLSATRPYGGTPIAGMFQDAKDYFWNDPAGPSKLPDPFVTGGCRKQFIILLTDGAPNQDMRPSCGNTDNPSAPCPYNLPETTVAALKAGNGATQPPVYTFVIGFAVSSGTDQGGTPVQCSTLDPAGIDCTNPTPQLVPCCTLQKIAVAGAPPAPPLQPGQPPAPPPRAYFADTAGDLNGALAAILGQIASSATTRTVPTTSSTTSNVVYSVGSTISNQNTFYSSFNPARPVPNAGAFGAAGVPWTGDIQRARYLCSATPPAQQVTVSQGDDFRQNLAVATGRNFIAVQQSGTPADSSTTIRPFITGTVPDGLPQSLGTQVAGNAATIISSLPTPALGFTAGNANSCQYTSTKGAGLPYLSDTQCASMLLDFTFGQTFSGPSDFPFVSRAGINAFGGIYHATPAVVGPPGALLHDDSYDVFRTLAQTTTPSMAPVGTKTRDTIVYAATTDGLLHAFWADVDKLQNNEEWAFLPPAVMPQLKSSYPASNVFLLDGAPVVKDVLWDRPLGKATNPGGNNPWRTTLVAGFGPAQTGYYAMDVTNPVFNANLPSAPSSETAADAPKGPVFLWQLTKMPTTNMPLFGQHGATPAITQVAINDAGNVVHDVGVAILPGGWDTAAVAPAGGGTAGCDRDTHHRSKADWNAPSGYPYRNSVRCWGSSGNYADAVTGRSVTIVRLDTGEILATFMRKYDATQYHPSDTLLAKNRIIDTPLDSPMTGTPAVYPAQVGADATKFFIGDMDGTIWRFDISSPDPTQWTGRLFFDIYNTTADSQNGTGVGDWSNGQPVALPLVLSLNALGQVVLHAASGSQDTFDASGPNFLVSLTEKVQTVAGVMDMRSSVNWYMGSKLPAGGPALPSSLMDVGERVSGPMTVFNNQIFFTTYSATVSTSSVCSAGLSRLWGADFINPNGSVSNGGAISGSPPWSGTKVNVALSPPLPSGVVVPGVSLQQTTACVQVNPLADLYVPGATHSSPSSFSAGGFSLVAQVGAPSTAGGAGVQTFSQALGAPSTATVIDSWATVTE